MIGLHYESGGACRVCGRQTDDYGTCVCCAKANARPSLERPAEGTCCPRCSEPLELEGYCGACDWRAS